MKKTKKMNEPALDKLLRGVNVEGESIRAKQDQKQSVMNDFEREKRRYQAGKISRTTLSGSAKRINKTMVRLDKAIRRSIARVNSLTTQAKKLAARQTPKPVRAKLAGIKVRAKKRAKRKKPRKKR